MRGYGSRAEELAGIARQVKEWLPPAGEPFSIGVALPSRGDVEEAVGYLDAEGIPVGAIGVDGPHRLDAVHVGTMHRFKGLEYQRMIVAGVTAAAVPPGGCPHVPCQGFRVKRAYPLSLP